jgi:NAD(P)-dependent dehydrogenase (short-subunit alcohol dehydrogenase family)
LLWYGVNSASSWAAASFVQELVYLTFNRTVRELQDDLEIIVRRHLVPLLKTARDATMENNIFSAFKFHTHGFHKSLACRLAIFRIHVNVPAPQILRTMVCVAVSAYKETAPFANEILFDTLEFLYHHGFRLISFLTVKVK